jgi:4-hydroxy-tetrahydrodipicolinate synthase
MLGTREKDYHKERRWCGRKKRRQDADITDTLKEREKKAMPNKKMYGVVVPIVTPMKKDRTVDYECLEQLVEFLIAKGIHGLYPGGSTGEMLLLSLEERKAVTESVIKTVAGRVPVFVQAGSMTLDDTVSLARHAMEVGADGVGMVTPSYFKLTEQALLNYYIQAAESLPVDFPVYLYGIPQMSGNDITVELALRVQEACPNVVGIKYSYADMIRIQNFIGTGTLSVLCGPDELFYLTLCAGGDGTISGNANVIPEHFVAIYDAFKNEEYKKAAAIQQRTNILCGILSSADNMARYKIGLSLRGLSCSGAMRIPSMALDEAAKSSLIERLTNACYDTVII